MSISSTPPQHPLIEDFRPENTDVDSQRTPSEASVVSSNASWNVNDGVEDLGSAAEVDTVISTLLMDDTLMEVDMAIWSVGSMDRVQLQDASSPVGMDVSFEKTIE